MKRWTYALPVFFLLLGLGFAAAAFNEDVAQRMPFFWHEWCATGTAAFSENCLDNVQSTDLIMAAIFVPMSLFLIGLYAWIGRGGAKAARLQRTGKQALALVESVEDTGVTVNQNPRVRLRLRVRPPGEPEFTIETSKVVSRLGIPQPGTTVPIRYDPADPHDFVFAAAAPGVAGGPGQDLEAMVRSALAAKGVTGALADEAVEKALAAAASGQSVVDLREYTQPGGGESEEDPLDRLKKLTELRDAGTLTPTEFEALKAKILADT